MLVMAREKLLRRINDKSARIGIVGLGYVGLPLMLDFSEAGFPVLGFDIDPQKVDLLNAGKSYFVHIPDSCTFVVYSSKKLLSRRDRHRPPSCTLSFAACATRSSSVLKAISLLFSSPRAGRSVECVSLTTTGTEAVLSFNHNVLQISLTLTILLYIK